MAANGYHHNHYVPVGYQRRFMRSGEGELYHLDLAPESFILNGRKLLQKDLHHRGPKHCFAQDDLYTTRFSNSENTEIERFFFGTVDNSARRTLDFWCQYDHVHLDSDAFEQFLNHMSLQKLRTPRGMAWLRRALGEINPSNTLIELQRLQNLFCATWTNCVWQIADASQSPTKFIISDNPVTIYNRDCFPASSACLFPNDPDIRLAGTQTVYPLSLDKVLILTNLTWARDPYQRATRMGPNHRLMRNAVFYFGDIQLGRSLSEEEVVEINYIIKRRAHRYIAAAEIEWLYPERHLRCDHWRKLGDGYLLMPDPRHVHMGGSVTVGYAGGGADQWSEYGHRPWEPSFEDKKRDEREAAALSRFQAEFSAMHGPDYRGMTEHFYRRQQGRVPEEIHAYYVASDAKNLIKPGERARRRALMRG